MTDAFAMLTSIYEDRPKHELWGLRQFLHENATWTVIGFGASTDARYAGGKPNAIAAFIDVMMQTWSWNSHEFMDILTSDTSLFCRFKVELKNLKTGEPIYTEGAEYFRLQNGFITEIISYPDPAIFN